MRMGSPSSTKRDGAAARRLRGHVPDGWTVGGAGETAVGHQGATVAETGPHQGGRGAEHLAHPGASLGSLVADHDARARPVSSLLRRASMALSSSSKTHAGRTTSHISRATPEALTTAPPGARLPFRM